MIWFQDPSLGTSSKNCNHVLTDLLRTLSLTSPGHKEIVRAVLLAAPDQVTQFLPCWKPGFVPRASEKWINMMEWLNQIYCDFDIIGLLSKHTGKILMEISRPLVIPSIFDKESQAAAFAESIPIASSVVFLDFLNKALIRVYVLSRSLKNEERTEFLSSYADIFIDPQLIAKYWKRMSEISTVSLPDDAARPFHVFFALYKFILSKGVSLDALPKSSSSFKVHAAAKLEVDLLLSAAEKECQSAKYGTASAHLNEEKCKARRQEIQDLEEMNSLRIRLSVLVLDIVRAAPSKVPLSIFAAVSSAYNATSSELDQNLFRILTEIDRAGIFRNMVSFSLFGKSALRHQQLSAAQGVAVMRQPSLREFLDSLDQNMIVRTSIQFPIRLPLCGEPLYPYHDETTYDPRYLLPNFVHLLTAGAVNVTHFIESGCLGIVVAAFGSVDESMRAVAGRFMRDFVKHAQALKFKGKEQLLYLLELMRRSGSMRRPWSNLWTVFIVRFLSVMFTTESNLYQVMMEFFLVKPKLALETVPEFLKMFESGSLSFIKDRKFILEILRDGMRNFLDYEVCLRSHIFQAILSMYGSPLSHRAQNLLVSEVLLSASKVPRVGRALIKVRSCNTAA